MTALVGSALVGLSRIEDPDYTVLGTFTVSRATKTFTVNRSLSSTFTVNRATSSPITAGRAADLLLRTTAFVGSAIVGIATTAP